MTPGPVFGAMGFGFVVGRGLLEADALADTGAATVSDGAVLLGALSGSGFAGGSVTVLFAGTGGVVARAPAANERTSSVTPIARTIRKPTTTGAIQSGTPAACRRDGTVVALDAFETCGDVVR